MRAGWIWAIFSFSWNAVTHMCSVWTAVTLLQRSHFVPPFGPRITFSKNEACKTQLLFWSGGQSLFIWLLSKHHWEFLSGYWTHWLIFIKKGGKQWKGKTPWSSALLKHINNPDQLTCWRRLERYIFHKVWAFICHCGEITFVSPMGFCREGGFRARC